MQNILAFTISIKDFQIFSVNSLTINFKYDIILYCVGIKSWHKNCM